jgi:hypothetical protein
MNMKQIIGIAFLALTINGFAQDKSSESKSGIDPKKLDLSKRTSDHLMIQVGLAGWGSKPSSITTKTLNRTFNAYFMFDFPFKTNPKLSVGIGPGVGTDNIYFDKMSVDLNPPTGVRFQRDTIVKYKKNKLATGYFEVPVELRYSTRPDNMNRGWKFALGVKVGTMIDAKTKAKIDLDATGTGGYWAKEKDRRHFNSTRFAVIGRAGWGNISMFGSYTLTDFFKEGQGPVVRPFSVGLVLSGL